MSLSSWPPYRPAIISFRWTWQARLGNGRAASGISRSLFPQLCRRQIATYAQIVLHTPSGHFHAVRFYEDERSLCRIVADFVGDGLVAGEPAVVIATPSHTELICQALEGLSFNVGTLREQNDLTVLDAGDTLSSFMIAGAPDAPAFRSAVGGAINATIAGRSKPRLRAYGEMVDLLWKQEQPEAAIRLEVLWNQLANDYPFSLLCGYSLGHFYKVGAYEHICAHHTHVVSASGQPTRINIA